VGAGSDGAGDGEVGDPVASTEGEANADGLDDAASADGLDDAAEAEGRLVSGSALLGALHAASSIAVRIRALTTREATGSGRTRADDRDGATMAPILSRAR